MQDMNTEGDIVDYAKPLIDAERRLKEVHELCLAKRYADAYEVVMHTLVSLRGLEAVLVCMNAEEASRNKRGQA